MTDLQELSEKLATPKHGVVTEGNKTTYLKEDDLDGIDVVETGLMILLRCSLRGILLK